MIWSVKDWTCTSCGDTGELLFMESAGPLCLDCSDLEHLLFLPSGDAALTRRAKKASRLSAVVVRWSRSRKRYERQGILAEAEAIERAENECLADAEVRARGRERDQARRADEDVEFADECDALSAATVPGLPRRSGRGHRTACGDARQRPDRAKRSWAGA